MKEVKFKVDGMMCGMCEAHVKDAIRKEDSNAKSIKVSHSTGKVSFITSEFNEEKVIGTISDLGYKPSEVSCYEYEKKSFFAGFLKK